MSDIIINGVKGAYLQPLVFGQNETGFYRVETYNGTRDELIAKIPGILLNGGSYEFQESRTGAADAIVARYPLNFITPEVPVNDWELFAQVEVKDILEADIAAVRGMDAAKKSAIRRAIEDHETISSLSGDELELFNLMKSDPTVGHRTVVPTLRHTMTFSYAYTIGAALDHVEEIWSTASLTAFESTMFQSVKDNLPNRADPSFGDGVTRRYGWLKAYPTFRIALNQRAQLVQEFIYGLWPTIIYGSPI